jgi:hypothetical protein
MGPVREARISPGLRSTVEKSRTEDLRSKLHFSKHEPGSRAHASFLARQPAIIQSSSRQGVLLKADRQAQSANDRWEPSSRIGLTDQHKDRPWLQSSGGSRRVGLFNNNQATVRSPGRPCGTSGQGTGAVWIRCTHDFKTDTDSGTISEENRSSVEFRSFRPDDRSRVPF